MHARSVLLFQQTSPCQIRSQEISPLRRALRSAFTTRIPSPSSLCFSTERSRDPPTEDAFPCFSVPQRHGKEELRATNVPNPPSHPQISSSWEILGPHQPTHPKILLQAGAEAHGEVHLLHRILRFPSLFLTSIKGWKTTPLLNHHPKLSSKGLRPRAPRLIKKQVSVE